MRKISREVLFKLVFAKRFGDNTESLNDEELLNVVINEMGIKIEDVDVSYVLEALKTIVSNFDSYVELVNEVVPKYKSSRIYNVDLVVMVLAVFEAKVNELNKKIAISEAVKLVKKYSTDRSIKFVNGVLSTILKDEDE